MKLKIRAIVAGTIYYPEIFSVDSSGVSFQTEIGYLKTDKYDLFLGLSDKNGKKIHKGDIFEFEYLEDLNKSIKLIGSFDYCEEELRYEIDIWNNPRYTVLSYISNGTMYNFKIIGNIHQNPELLK